MAASAKPEPAACGQLGASSLGGPDCLCRAAVMRAYNGMTTSGAPYDSALSAASRVFRHHHPEFQSGVRELIEQWISPESIH
jgi:hypothetical protein